MIPTSKSVICLKGDIELTEGSVLFGFEKVKLRTGYWKIVDRLQGQVRMKELHTGQFKLVSLGMLGKLVSTPTTAINFISEDDVPSVINL